MYTAKGTSAFVVPLANVLKAYTGSWHAVFVVATIMNLIVVGLALFVVRPIRLSTAGKQSAVGQPAE
jgi:OFA family oxalate/formate antiporter-like MFS transporter